MRSAQSALLLLPLIVSLAGCGSSQAVWVKGTVTKSGTAYKVPEGENLDITFYTLESISDGDRKIPAGEPFSGTFNQEDSSFTVPGPEGNGIPPGKYKISLIQKLDRESVDKKNASVKKGQKRFDRDTDLLKGRFGEESPIVREIKVSGDLIIDLDKPTP